MASLRFKTPSRPQCPAPPNLFTEREIRRCRESLETIIDLARDEVDRLYAIVEEEGWVVLFCNGDGVVIHHRGDEAKANEFRHFCPIENAPRRTQI
jgi:transcriptional regulator of acetoin/glycerol metabolism